MNPQVREFFHEPTGTFSYVVYEEGSSSAAVVDPVLDYDHKSGQTSTASADEIVRFVESNALDVEWILETHAHADHITAAPYLRRRLGGRIAIGEGIRRVQANFKAIFNIEDLDTNGVQFDRLFSDGETFAIGGLEVRIVNTPGHTSDSVSYVVGDAVFVGDTLFAPDFGTARTDFPGGDAHELYRSIQRLFELPDDTRVFLCHDYAPGGRAPEHVHHLRKQRAENVHVHDGVGEAAFVELREARDAKLEMPTLIIPSVQLNIRAGEFPAPEDNGIVYLKVPVDTLGREA